jgi:aryl-alcohol dehydrogenase-like predicted oxidoreductase
MGWRTPTDMAVRLLDQYVEAGGTFLDTANIYGRIGNERVGGLSEHVLGQWMRERRNRSRLFIASKVGFEYADVERGLPADRIIAECDKSLKRMGLETIDLYYAHVDDRTTPMEETLQAFDRLVKAGKVRFIGASNFAAWRLERAQWVSRTHGWPEYCCIQQRHSYLRPVPGASTAPQVIANQDLLDYCQSGGITLLAYSPLLGGAYGRTDKPLSKVYVGPDSDARLRALRQVAQEIGATPNQVILAWMMHSTPCVLPVFAASNPEQMTENLNALHLTLNTEQMERLDSASDVQQN